jgi:hypothetical protein
LSVAATAGSGSAVAVRTAVVCPAAAASSTARRRTDLEQHAIDLPQQLDERDEDLTAARATNRELMGRINAPNQIPLGDRVPVQH